MLFRSVSDTLLVLQGVQTICLTVRAGKTPRKAAMRALQTLQSSEVRVAGIILNCMKRRRGGSYYYNYYDYSYHDESDDKAEKHLNGESTAARKEQKVRGGSISV